MKLIKCTNCEKEFYRKDKLVKNKNFCSIKCYSVYKKENNENIKKIKCVICGSEIYRHLSQIKNKNYCSIKCRIAGSCKHNELNIIGDVCYINTIYKRKEYKIIIDKKDYELCKNYYWTLRANKHDLYAQSITHINGRTNRTHLHRLIMSTPSGLVTDHINGDTLDNRRENLRVVTQSENCLNRHRKHKSILGITGVYKDKKSYTARFKGEYLGSFKTVQEAKETRKNAEIKHQNRFTK